jgi:Pyruvate/2-oxoacid:ferredoxin oxidoreductase delta subunit
VCGCGGLAETAGDPWRHLSDKSINAWKIERWMIHAVLLFSFVMTIAVVYSYLGKDPSKYSLTQTGFTWIIIGLLLALAAAYAFLQKKNADGNKNKIYLASGSATLVAIILGMNWLFGSGNAFFLGGDAFKSSYGFYIGALFSGVVGVGFYPIMGSRVWCRFGCPMAAILGLQQKLFSKFRITTNGGQCISCGNCSTYCEMGIDVRSYAQKGQNIVRASCVGCGICSAVCPRGVLRLENGSEDIFNKTDEYKAIHISNEGVKIDLLR